VRRAGRRRDAEVGSLRSVGDADVVGGRRLRVPPAPPCRARMGTQGVPPERGNAFPSPARLARCWRPWVCAVVWHHLHALAAGAEEPLTDVAARVETGSGPPGARRPHGGHRSLVRRPVRRRGEATTPTSVDGQELAVVLPLAQGRCWKTAWHGLEEQLERDAGRRGQPRPLVVAGGSPLLPIVIRKHALATVPRAR